MQDYETGEGLSEEETQLAMFAAAYPTYFEDAIKKQEMEESHGYGNGSNKME